MSHAEDECQKQHPRLAAFIRDQRLQFQDNAAFIPCWNMMIDLVMQAMRKDGILPKGL